MSHWNIKTRAGLEVIKLESILKLKIKRNDWLLADTCPQAANHCALFEFETVLKFNNSICNTWPSVSSSKTKPLKHYVKDNIFCNNFLRFG